VRTLGNFSQGVEVWFLQRILNRWVTRTNGRLRPVTEDGRFGNEIEAAVRRFQAQARPRLVEDGVVGPRTWSALGLQIEIDHPIRLIPQNSNWSCWNAAVTMKSETRGGRQSIMTGPDHMQYYLSSGMSGVAADQALARELGWRVLDHSPELQELISIMRRTPIYVGGRLTAATSHAVVFGGLYSDGLPDGTMIKVYNPAPLGTGLIHPMRYLQWVCPISGFSFVPFSFLVLS
jgi:hypothetical protein